MEDLIVKNTKARANRNVKGQMRVVESIMAALIVITAITFLYFSAPTPSSQAYDASELEKMGHNILHDFDGQGLLARYVYRSEWENLTLALDTALPVNVYFNLSIYDSNYHSIGHPLIPPYGDQRIFSSSPAVASVTYVIPGYGASYNPRILLLKLVNG